MPESRCWARGGRSRPSAASGRTASRAIRSTSTGSPGEARIDRSCRAGESDTGGHGVGWRSPCERDRERPSATLLVLVLPRPDRPRRRRGLGAALRRQDARRLEGQRRDRLVQGRGRGDRRHDRRGQPEHVPLQGGLQGLRARAGGQVRPPARTRASRSAATSTRRTTPTRRTARGPGSSTAPSARSPARRPARRGGSTTRAAGASGSPRSSPRPRTPSRTTAGTATGSSCRATAIARGSTASPPPTSPTTWTSAASSGSRSTASPRARGRIRSAGGTSASGS